MKIKLTEEEKRTERELEAGEWKPAPRAETEKIKAAARISASERINIRLFAGDTAKLKDRAQEAGMPYQVLAASVLHQLATGKLSLKVVKMA